MPSDIGWIQTASGGRFYPLRPRVEDVKVEDIAAALSRNCRFTGHCIKHYSVGEHSLLVCDILHYWEHRDPETILWGLLHDASEAYVSDIARPLKQQPEFAFYRDMEKQIMDTVCKKFDMSPDEPKIVKAADTLALAIEAKYLMPNREKDRWAWLPDIPDCLQYWGPTLGSQTSGTVEKRFLAEFAHLEKLRV
jgi:hypothetical protein